MIEIIITLTCIGITLSGAYGYKRMKYEQLEPIEDIPDAVLLNYSSS